ncbi:MAG: hypothetical protein ACOC31_03980 [Bacteroidota bacterium]
MLEHQMIVLSNVSTDKRLFKKELIKSLKWLDPIDCTKLLDWVETKYGHLHKDVIDAVLTETAA